jgi:hypothetical protein
MTDTKRRQFLQFSASAFAAIGLNQFDFLHQVRGVDRALAQAKPRRKLALLVGINSYPSGISTLTGCLTDVEMQYELLVHRYGFDPKNILVLADRALPFLDYTPKVGTRANILQAFQQHLIDQAEPGDAVIFHYSGHGSRVTDPMPLAGYGGLNGTLVPADVALKGDDGTNQIMGKTLFLLSSLLKTNHFTMVLDSCHSGAGTRGNSVVRSTGLTPRNGQTFCRPDAEELALQRQLLERLKESPEMMQQRRAVGIARGMALGSAQKEQEAIDAKFDGFSAGMFTYLLTRYLWQLPRDESLKTTFDSLGLATKEASNRTQEPIYDVQPQKNFENQPIYFMPAAQQSFADAVVRKMDGDQVQFWLGGVSAQSLKAFTTDAVFDVLDAQGKSIATVTQVDRTGLAAIGKVTQGTPNLQAGMLMRERVRSIPTDLTLRVGLDPSLGREVDAATAELAKIASVEPVVLGTRSTGGVHCILGRLTAAGQQAARRGSITLGDDVKLNSWGLFNEQAVPIPGTFQRGDLPVAGVVQALRSRLKLLLANQILSSTVNGDSSSLKVQTVIRPQAGRPGPVLTRLTAGLGGTPQQPGLSQGYRASTERTASVVEIAVSNQEAEQSLHMATFALGDDGVITLLHPASWNSPESASLIAAGATTTVEMQVYGPAGVFEVLVVASTEPLRDLLRGMQSIARGRGLAAGTPILFDGETRSAGDSEDAIGNLMANLVGDMSRASGGPPSRGRALTSAKAVAVMAIPVQVVD